MKIFKKEIDKDKLLYGGLIATFIVLYGATAFVSWYHAITFFNIANAVWLSVLLSFVAEIGQASVLFSILLTENKHKFLPWAVMIILTTLQVIGNVVSSYDWIVQHNGAGVESFQKSILFFMTAADPEIFRVVIAWISGALLPIIALSMTALVAQNMELRAGNSKTVLDSKDEPQPLIEDDPKVRMSDEDFKRLEDILNKKKPIDQKDIIEDITKIHPSTEDIKKLEDFLSKKEPVEKLPVEEASIEEKKTSHPLGFTDEDIKLNKELNKEERKIMNERVKHLTSSVEYDPDIDLAKQLIVNHQNGLIEGITETQIINPQVSPSPSPESLSPPEPTPSIKVDETKGEPINTEQLERIRQIARDNLKKK